MPNIEEITTEILDKDKDADVIYQIVEILKNTYRDRVKQIILFGSHHDDIEGTWTGIEIMAFIENLGDRWEETRRIAGLVKEISLDFGITVGVIPFDVSVLESELKSRFLESVLEKGVPL